MSIINSANLFNVLVSFLFLLGCSQQIVIQCSASQGVTDSCSFYKGTLSKRGEKIFSIPVDASYEHIMFMITAGVSQVDYGQVGVSPIKLSNLFDTSRMYDFEHCDYLDKDGSEPGQDDKECAYRADLSINSNSISPSKIKTLLDAENAKLSGKDKLKPIRFSAVYCGGAKLMTLTELRNSYPKAPIEKKIASYKYGNLVFSLTIPFVNRHFKGDSAGSKVYIIHLDNSCFPILGIVCQGQESSDIFRGRELISNFMTGRLTDTDKIGPWPIKSIYFFKDLACGKGSLNKQGAFFNYELPTSREYSFWEQGAKVHTEYPADKVETFAVELDKILI